MLSIYGAGWAASVTRIVGLTGLTAPALLGWGLRVIVCAWSVSVWVVPVERSVTRYCSLGVSPRHFLSSTLPLPSRPRRTGELAVLLVLRGSKRAIVPEPAKC